METSVGFSPSWYLAELAPSPWETVLGMNHRHGEVWRGEIPGILTLVADKEMVRKKTLAGHRCGGILGGRMEFQHWWIERPLTACLPCGIWWSHVPGVSCEYGVPP